jgi:hypothetical protein
VAHQPCGALGKIVNCQSAVSTALIAQDCAWLPTLESLMPRPWIDDPARREALGIPARQLNQLLSVSVQDWRGGGQNPSLGDFVRNAEEEQRNRTGGVSLSGCITKTRQAPAFLTQAQRGQRLACFL